MIVSGVHDTHLKLTSSKMVSRDAVKNHESVFGFNVYIDVCVCCYTNFFITRKCISQRNGMLHTHKAVLMDNVSFVISKFI